MVKNKKYIFGDGCNMAYRKSYYIENRGFAKNSQSYLGYDYDRWRYDRAFVLLFDSYLFDCLRFLPNIRVSCHVDSIFNGCNFVKYLRYLSETKKIIPNFVYY